IVLRSAAINCCYSPDCGLFPLTGGETALLEGSPAVCLEAWQTLQQAQEKLCYSKRSSSGLSRSDQKPTTTKIKVGHPPTGTFATNWGVLTHSDPGSSTGTPFTCWVKPHLPA